MGPGVAAPVTSIGAKLAAKEIAGHQVTLTPPAPKKPGKVKAPARTGAFSGHAPASGYSVKGEEMYVLELVKAGDLPDHDFHGNQYTAGAGGAHSIPAHEGGHVGHVEHMSDSPHEDVREHLRQSHAHDIGKESGDTPEYVRGHWSGMYPGSGYANGSNAQYGAMQAAHSAYHGYSKGESTLDIKKSEEADMTATQDEFYVFTEDGITKLAGPFATEDAAIAEIEKFAAEVAAEKRDFTQAERDEAEKKGHAMPGGGFPINTAEDLANAKQAVGRAKDPAAARAHINEQAARLGKPGLSKFGERFWDLVKDAASLPSWGASLIPTDGGEGGTQRQVSETADRPTDNVSSGSHIVIQVAPATENGEAAGLTLAPETEDGADLVQKFAIAKRDDAQRFTYGVAYPASRLDIHGDFMTAEDLEKSAWAFFKKADAGTMHVKGTEGAGQVVESHIWRGPVTKFGDEEVRPGDWMLGVIWGPETWDRIQRSELRGYSFQGFAKRTKSPAPGK